MSSFRGRDDDDRDGDSRSGRRLMARRGVVGVLAGALIMLLAASALAATGNLGVLGLTSEESAAPGVLDGASSAPVEQGVALTSAPGDCLTWTRADGSDVRRVECSTPHLFEIAGPVTAEAPEGAPFPADDAWQRLVTEQCAPLAQSYLGGALDPVGRYQAGALKPTAAAWADGDRAVRCGLQAPGRTGALFSSTGRVADADQAVVFAPGTCLGLDGGEVSDPVTSCDRVHAAEVAGSVDLGTQFPAGLPSVDDQDDFLQPECTRVATEAVGEGPLAESGLTVYWTNIGQPSWDAGTRRVSCNMGALLPDGSGFAPLTGAVATGVTVGGAAPAEPEPLPQPGAPAPEPTPAGAAPAAPPAPGAPTAPAEPVPGGAGPDPAGDPVVPPTTPQGGVLGPLPLPGSLGGG